MKKNFLLLLVVLLVGSTIGSSDLVAQMTKVGKRNRKPIPPYTLVPSNSLNGKYTFFTVTGDPLRTRIYTLSNGLTVYMTVNKSEPRIYTSIAVRAGAKNDPADATGLAHYLEHMLFKGTDKYGSLDFKKEQKLLDKIEALYEKYRSTTDAEERKALYREIDEVSGEAAKYAIANEYDKMLSAIGAKGTNAYTSFEQTVYINDIPANQLQTWLKIEGERFRNPILRLFHTELEAVYEEKNISLDSDGRAVFTAILDKLFPTHNYGQQTTIGTIPHLKNPSIKKIKEYYANYYVPNNMAVCISGDFDPEQAIEWIDEQFGYYQSKPITPYEAPTEDMVKKITAVNLEGPEAESVMIGYRLPGVATQEALVMEMIDMILTNSQAGLIDVNLNQKQKVLSAYTFAMGLKDYSMHAMNGTPKEGQSLEEVKDLILAEVENVKQGNFDDGLIKAIVNNLEIQKMEQFESNRGRTSEFVESFTTGQEWVDYVQRLEKMRKITKDDVVTFANKYYKDNYTVVYKRKGERVNEKVEKPEITPVAVNREAQSDFLKSIVSAEAPTIAPRFLDYEKDIAKKQLNGGIPLHYVKNEENSLFTMYYLLDVGKMHDKKLAYAVEYLPFLGTSKYSAEEISKKFYELGLSYDVFQGQEKVYVYLSGLTSSFEEGVQLFEHLLTDAQPDTDALRNLVGRTLKSRTDAKLNKRAILRGGMSNFARYGARNPFNDVMSEKELQALNAKDLAEKIHNLTGYEHKVLYYGPETIDRVAAVVNNGHKVPANLRKAPEVKPYVFQENKANKVYFVHYEDMVQAEVMWMTKSFDYNPDMAPILRLYNEYYGGGMSSIIFQTIRESKALAYSTYSSFSTPEKKEDPHMITAYVGTQADKIHDAMAGMMELLEEMPKSENMLNGGKQAIKNKIETERINRTSILFNYESAKRRGLTADSRKAIYEQVANLNFDDVKKFHEQYVAGNQYNIMILGSRDKIDLKSLEQYGPVEELDLEELFGY